MLKKLLLSVLAIFGLTFLLSSNSYAVSDLVYTLDSSSSTTYLCETSHPCSDYSYLIVSYSGSSALDTLQLSFYTGPSSSNYVIFGSFTSVIEFPGSSYTQVRAYPGLSSISSGSSFTVTLSENNPLGGITPEGSISITSNGTYDVTNYASAVVNISSDLPPYSQIVVDSFWKYHIAIAGGLASIFAIFIVYRIIRSRLR